MESCRETRPDRKAVEPVVQELAEINMFDYWRDLQLWAMSATQIAYNGKNEPPDNPNGTRYVEVVSDPVEYILVATTKTFDGYWWQYDYVSSRQFGKPDDVGEIFYNTLGDGTVDKFQIDYVWNDLRFERDSIFVGNFTRPLDNLTISYRYNKDLSVSKLEKNYFFEVDKFTSYQKVLQNFLPPADNGTESCSGKKTVVKKYTFDEDTELFVSHDYVFGYIVGSCGFDGYVSTGTSTGVDWSFVGNGSLLELSNDILTDKLVADGVLTSSFTGQKLTLEITATGSFEVKSSFNLGFGQSLTIETRNNAFVFSVLDISEGGVTVDRDGTYTGTTMVSPFYSQYLDGQVYEFNTIRLYSSSGAIALEVTDGSGSHSTGTVDTTI